jgi:hypothetical protein
MSPIARSKPSKSLQILVFQDDLASRQFVVPLRWFGQLGWILGGSILTGALAIGAAISIWRSSHRSQPERLRELELQIQSLETQLTQRPATAPIPEVKQSPAPLTAVAPEPAPTVTVTVTAPSESSFAKFNPFLQKSDALPPSSAVVFSAFPNSVTGEVPWIARPSIPIEMTQPQLQWQGRKLKVRFDIRFIGPEGKSQQGRIVVAARGPETLMVYPSGALRAAGSPSLIDPEQGEYFSVSRYRETRVEFPSVDSPLRTLEIFLIGTDTIDQQNKVLIHESFNIPSTGGTTRAADPENT